MKKSRTSIRVKYRGRDVTSKLSERLRGYLKENWGAPFIIAFMAMLLTAAGYLTVGLENIANDIAMYAYYSLVIGVVLQLICYLKYGGGENE